MLRTLLHATSRHSFSTNTVRQMLKSVFIVFDLKLSYEHRPNAVPLLRTDFVKVRDYRNDIIHAHSMNSTSFLSAKNLIKTINEQLDVEIGKIIVDEEKVPEDQNRNFNTAISEAIRDMDAAKHTKTWQEQLAELHTISLEPHEGWVELYPLESQGINTVWRWGKEKSANNLNINIMAKPMRNGSYMIVEKYRESKMMARSVWWDKDTNTEKGTLLVKDIMDGKVFDYPKPMEEQILHSTNWNFFNSLYL